ncbi:hypothetical protein B0H13DRAFT_2314739 [Mycena leptocephala]|nr:hypothetical protein B0H13DRAFT_2314739 [Mycena leptocephala]
MILPCSSALVILAWSLGDVVAIPLAPSTTSGSSSPPSASTASGGSANDSIPVFDPHIVGHLPVVLPPTIKQQLNTTLTNLSPGALERWVTAEPIALTSLGLDNPTDSNEDLASFVDHMFTDDPSKPGEAGWVDTYISFLIEAGSTNITQTQESALFANYNNSTTAFATAQVKLVKAYEDANPDNVTYVGINIYNTARIDPLSLNVIEKWGAQGNGSYSKDAFADYVKLNKTLSEVKAQYMELTQSVQLAFDGSLYKISLNNAPSMVVGGDLGSLNARVVPAWGATIVNNTIISPSAVQQLPANFTNNGTSASASSAISQPSGSSSAVVASSAAAAARSIPSNKQGRAFSPVKSVAKNKNITNHSPQTPSSSSSSASGTISTSTGSTDPLGDISDELKGNLMVFSISPGRWYDTLASNVAFAVKERPDVANKYFGNGTSGMGPIGRIWTHICVITTDNPATPGLDTVQILGKVWDVLPALKG